MPTLNVTTAAFVASLEFDRATLSRLCFWSEARGSHELLASPLI